MSLYPERGNIMKAKSRNSFVSCEKGDLKTGGDRAFAQGSTTIQLFPNVQFKDH